MLSCFVVLLSCHVFFVVLPVSFRSDFTLLPVLCLILPSHVLPSRFGLAPSAFNLSYDVLFCSCRYWLPLCVAFSLRFLRVVFCRSLVLSRFSALRVSPAETRLTVYRRLSIQLRSDRPSSGARNIDNLLTSFSFVLLMFLLSLVILLHSICCLCCKASIFDRRIVERL